jgi:hypothetical protein
MTEGSAGTGDTVYDDLLLRKEIRLKAFYDSGVELSEDLITMGIMFMEKMKVSFFHGHVWINRRKSDGEIRTTWELTADGHRAIARRHGLAGIDAPHWAMKEDGKTPLFASVTVYRRVGTWSSPHSFERYTGVAYYDEFVEKTREGVPNWQWSRRPKNQLAKCAEVQALSKGFPETGTDTVFRIGTEIDNEIPRYVDAEPVEPTPEPAEHEEEEPQPPTPNAEEIDPSEIEKIRNRSIPLIKEYCMEFRDGIPMSWKTAFTLLCGTTLEEGESMTVENYTALEAALIQDAERRKS